MLNNKLILLISHLEHLKEVFLVVTRKNMDAVLNGYTEGIVIGHREAITTSSSIRWWPEPLARLNHSTNPCAPGKGENKYI